MSDKTQANLWSLFIGVTLAILIVNYFTGVQTMDYRAEQILNVKITQSENDGYKLKITSLKNATKWLNITPQELEKIYNVIKGV